MKKYLILISLLVAAASSFANDDQQFLYSKVIGNVSNYDALVLVKPYGYTCGQPDNRLPNFNYSISAGRTVDDLRNSRLVMAYLNDFSNSSCGGEIDVSLVVPETRKVVSNKIYTYNIQKYYGIPNTFNFNLQGQKTIFCDVDTNLDVGAGISFEVNNQGALHATCLGHQNFNIPTDCTINKSAVQCIIHSKPQLNMTANFASCSDENGNKITPSLNGVVNQYFISQNNLNPYQIVTEAKPSLFFSIGNSGMNFFGFPGLSFDKSIGKIEGLPNGQSISCTSKNAKFEISTAGDSFVR